MQKVVNSNIQSKIALSGQVNQYAFIKSIQTNKKDDREFNSNPGSQNNSFEMSSSLNDYNNEVDGNG